MATLETDSDSNSVSKFWERKSGPLKLTDALKDQYRAIAVTSFIGLAVAGLLLGVSVDVASGGDLTGAGMMIAFAGAFGWLGLDSLDLLDCELRENHECRRCRKETERWKANGEVER